MSARLGRDRFRLLAFDSVRRCYVEQKMQGVGCYKFSNLMQKNSKNKRATKQKSPDKNNV